MEISLQNCIEVDVPGYGSVCEPVKTNRSSYCLSISELRNDNGGSKCAQERVRDVHVHLLLLCTFFSLHFSQKVEGLRGVLHMGLDIGL